MQLLESRGGSTALDFGDAKPGVLFIVGVNGGGKTTTIGKLAHKFVGEGASVSRPWSTQAAVLCQQHVLPPPLAAMSAHSCTNHSLSCPECDSERVKHITCTVQVLLAAGDTFRAAAAEQLQTWAERAGADFFGPKTEKQRPDALLYQVSNEPCSDQGHP